MSQTTNLGLPFIEGGQAQKHVTHNEALRILDAVIHIAVQDVMRTAPPPAPEEGDRHIVATGAEEAWAGRDNAIAAYEDGAWRFVTPRIGWCAWSVADNVVFVFDGAVWRDQRDLPVVLDNLLRLGVNTTADGANLFSVKSNAALIAAIAETDGGSGDVRLQLSKESAAGTASVFFSDAYAGRAEFGLVGDNAFKLKVSPDGATWTDAFDIDVVTGVAATPLDALSTGGMQINGGMEVSQETGNTAVTLTASASLQSRYVVDGVQAHYRGSFVAVAQQAVSPFPGTAKALRIGITTAQASLGGNDELSVVLPIEGVRTSRLAFGSASAAPLSLGFWFSAQRPGIYSGAIRNGARNRSWPFTFTVAEADTRQWVSLSGLSAIAGDVTGAWSAGSDVGLSVTICLAAGAARCGAPGAWIAADCSGAAGTTNGVAAVSDEFYIGNVIVLPGLYQPGAERAAHAMRPADEELRVCQRYYEKSFAASVAPATGLGEAQAFEFIQIGPALAAQVAGYVRFASTKRATPTVTFYNPVNPNGQIRSIGGSADWSATVMRTGNDGGFVFQGTSPSVGAGATAAVCWVADARL